MQAVDTTSRSEMPLNAPGSAPDHIGLNSAAIAMTLSIASAADQDLPIVRVTVFPVAALRVNVFAPP